MLPGDLRNVLDLALALWDRSRPGKRKDDYALLLFSVCDLLTISQHVWEPAALAQQRASMPLGIHTERTKQNQMFAILALSGFDFWKFALTSEELSVPSRPWFLEVTANQFQYEDRDNQLK